MSDELALLDPRLGHVTPLPRPIGLKNESIELIRSFAPRAIVGPIVRETIKGSPEFDHSSLDRAYETRLYDYYGRDYYWL